MADRPTLWPTNRPTYLPKFKMILPAQHKIKYRIAGFYCESFNFTNFVNSEVLAKKFQVWQIVDPARPRNT